MEKAVAPRTADTRRMDMLFWVFLAAGLLLFACVTIPPGARRSQALKADVARADAVSTQLALTNEILRQRERALESDPFYNEAVLRAKMKFTRPGEKEVVIPPTSDRRLFIEMPQVASYVPSRIDAPGLADRVASWALLGASALLVATAFIFFDQPVAARSFRIPV